MSSCVFVQIRCHPGTTYAVAQEIHLRELVSELYSTSGEFDLMMKIYVPEGVDVGKYLNDRLFDVPGISRSLTTMTFSAIRTPDEG
jgi:DNA-binding Lrp family transcriptional regulator